MKKHIFILAFFLLTVAALFAKISINLPQTDEQARAFYNQLAEKNPAFEEYLLVQDTKKRIGFSAWKIDGKANIWFLLTKKQAAENCIVRVPLEKGELAAEPSFFNPPEKNLINSFEVTDDGILFLDLTNSLTKHRQIVAMNTSPKDDSSDNIEVLIDFHGYKHWGNASLCYSSKSDRLYIETYGEGLFIEGNELLYDSGFYIFNRVDGKFSRTGMERVFSMAKWILSNAKKIFIDKEVPDYKGFLDWIYYYCDQGDKTFVFESSDGKTYTEEEGLKKYLEETSDYDNSMNLAPNLIKLKDGKADEESALSCVLNSPKSYPRYHEYQPYTAWLMNTDEGIWLFIQIAIQHLDEDGKSSWKTAYLKPYFLEDSKGEYPEISNNPLEAVRIAPVEDAEAVTAQNLYGMLVYKEKDSDGWNILKNGQIYKFEDYEKAKEAAASLYKGNALSERQKSAKSGITVPAFFLICVICLLELLIIIFILSKKFSQHLSIRDKRLVFKIQEAERTKLSHDIHDSVVQNIRAIRLEAEMLKVDAAEEANKEKVVQEMTEVISLLRNICYNFRPAELSVETNNTELISIIDTLCQQFIARTKIPCQIQVQKDFIAPVMDTEKSTNIVRAVQEALSNIEKHSYATRVQIAIQTQGGEGEKSLVIFIIDDGIGCEVSKLGRGKMNFGIRNMKERIAACGGKIEFFSTPNEGLTVQLRVPYE